MSAFPLPHDMLSRPYFPRAIDYGLCPLMTPMRLTDLHRSVTGDCFRYDVAWYGTLTDEAGHSQAYVLGRAGKGAGAAGEGTLDDFRSQMVADKVDPMSDAPLYYMRTDGSSYRFWQMPAEESAE